MTTTANGNAVVGLALVRDSLPTVHALRASGRTVCGLLRLRRCRGRGTAGSAVAAVASWPPRRAVTIGAPMNNGAQKAPFADDERPQRVLATYTRSSSSSAGVVKGPSSESLRDSARSTRRARRTADPVARDRCRRPLGRKDVHRDLLVARILATEDVCVGVLAVDEEPDDLTVRLAQMVGFSIAQAEGRASEVLDRMQVALAGLRIRSTTRPGRLTPPLRTSQCGRGAKAATGPCLSTRFRRRAPRRRSTRTPHGRLSRRTSRRCVSLRRLTACSLLRRRKRTEPRTGVTWRLTNRRRPRRGRRVTSD